MNDADVFIVISPKHKYVWVPRKSNKVELEYANKIVERILPVIFVCVMWFSW